VSLLLARAGTEFGTGSIATYLLLPYLIACCGCLLIKIYAHGLHQGFACTIFCFFLILLLPVLYKTYPVVYEQASVGVWGMLCVLCAVIIVVGLYHLFKKTAYLDPFPKRI
jgi:tryptophan-rich sensory protein